MFLTLAREDDSQLQSLQDGFSPFASVSRQSLGGGFAKGWSALRLPALEKRGQPDLDLTADFPRSLAGIGEADLGGAAQAEVPAVARLLDPAHPVLATSRLHDEIEAKSVGESSGTGSRLDGADR